MSFLKLPLWVLLLLIFVANVALGESDVVVFHENGFPSADSVSAPESLLRSVLPHAEFADADRLRTRLASAKLLVIPYGSAFPEPAWADIQSFLQRGGNLLVLGGRPFTRAAYRDGGAWKLRDYSVRYARPLMIDQYQETPGSQDLNFESNPDVPLNLPQFSWAKGFSPIMHLSAVDLYQRDGSAGSIDANLDPLAWGTKDGRRMSVPVIQIDHFRNGFDGGRWIFVDAELGSDFYSSAAAHEVLAKLSEHVMGGAEEFTVRPVMPLYLPEESVELEVLWNVPLSTRPSASSGCRIATSVPGRPGDCIPAGAQFRQVSITTYPQGHPESKQPPLMAFSPFIKTKDNCAKRPVRERPACH